MEIIDIAVRGGLGVLSILILRVAFIIVNKIKDGKEIDRRLSQYELDYQKRVEKMDAVLQEIFCNCKKHSEKIIRLEEKYSAMRDNCEHNHSWNGMDRRKQNV